VQKKPPAMPKSKSSYSVQTLFAPVQIQLELVEQKMLNLDEMLFTPLAERVIELIESGGKRLRPALTLMAAKMNMDEQTDPDSATIEHVIAVAAAVELLHTATLVHDDVIDDADTRRGVATLNTRWDAGSTVLAGNYIFGQAILLAAQTGNMRVINIFSDTLQVLVDGEVHQLSARDDYGQDKSLYYQRIYGKTASLFCAATEAAAVLSGLEEPAIKQIRDYGYNFGMAFQIMDDILDFTSDEATLGKPAGSDLRQGTFTLPFLHFAQENPDAVSSLRRAYSQNMAKDDPQWHTLVDEVVEMIRVSPAIAAARQEAADFLTEAKGNLANLPANVYRQSMLDLCDFVVERTY